MFEYIHLAYENIYVEGKSIKSMGVNSNHSLVASRIKIYLE